MTLRKNFFLWVETYYLVLQDKFPCFSAKVEGNADLEYEANDMF